MNIDPPNSHSQVIVRDKIIGYSKFSAFVGVSFKGKNATESLSRMVSSTLRAETRLSLLGENKTPTPIASRRLLNISRIVSYNPDKASCRCPYTSRYLLWPA
jgi:hypothetical protein